MVNSIDTERFKSNLQSKAEISSGQIKSVKSSSRDDEGLVDEKTLVSITCLESALFRLVASSNKISSMYPSFQRARKIYMQDYNPPKGSTLVRLHFKDGLYDWHGSRIEKLIIDIAKITGVDKDTIELVEISKGSVFIVLRLPEAAAKSIVEKEIELKEKFPELDKIELIRDLGRLVSFATR